jgi:flagellar biosynthetic protein FliR
MLELDEYATGVILILCRIGTTLMLSPGFGTARVPARVRLYLALALALAAAPVVLDGNTLKLARGGLLLGFVVAECIVGAVIGLVCRIYVTSLEFMMTAVSNYIGLNGLAAGIDTEDAAPTLATLIALTATLLILLLDFHHVLIKTVLDSYGRIPLGGVAEPEFSLRMLASTLDIAFKISLQVTGPFIVYAILVNVLFGILGKLIPQVPSYFISIPFLLMGGLFFLYLMVPEMLQIYFDAFNTTLTNL